jgi:tetratricopeptide (TPR) repeat protein
MSTGYPNLKRGNMALKKIVGGMSLFLIVVCSYGCFTSETNKAYIRYKQQGDSLALRSAFEDAIKVYTKAISVDPDSALEAYQLRALCYFNVRLYDLALQDLVRAETINQKNEQTFLLKARVEEVLHKWEEAINDYTVAIQLCPNDTVALNNRGTVYNRFNDHTDALNDFDKVISLDSNYWQAYNNRALVYQQLGDNAKAIDDYNRALTLNPRAKSSYANRGVCYLSFERYEEAYRDLDTANKLNPSDPVILTHLAVALYHLGNKEEARTDWQLAATMGDTDAQLYLAKYYSGI